MTRILIVDDDPVALKLTAATAEHAGFLPVTASGGEAALRALRSDPGIAAVILDLVMPDLDGMAIMEAMAREELTTPVIVQTAHSSLESVTSAMNHGAVDFFVKPVAPERLVVSLRNAVQLRTLETLIRREGGRRSEAAPGEIVTRSPAMERMLAQCAKAAKSPLPVLIEGEPGTGKELAARMVLAGAGKPPAVIDCTGWNLDFPAGGPILLKNAGELSADGQARLLRLMEQSPGTRIVATTCRRLLTLAKTGEMREDLYYRLNVFPIYVPPLRDRREDIPLLARHFLARACAETGRRIHAVSNGALALLQSYAWPGNVRQLENAIYRAVAMSDGPELLPTDFPNVISASAGRDQARYLTASLAAPSAPVHIDAAIPRTNAPATKDKPDRFLTAKGDVAALSDLERDLIAFAIRHYAGRMSRVARALKIGRSTLYRKLKEYGLDDGIESDAA